MGKGCAKALYWENWSCPPAGQKGNQLCSPVRVEDNRPGEGWESPPVGDGH